MQARRASPSKQSARSAPRIPISGRVALTRSEGTSDVSCETLELRLPRGKLTCASLSGGGGGEDDGGCEDGAMSGGGYGAGRCGGGSCGGGGE